MFTKFELVKRHVLENLHIEEMEVVKRIQAHMGFIPNPDLRISRHDIGIEESFFIHLDIGGEGYNEHMGMFSGFTSSINVNATEYQSNQYNVRIPNLVKVRNWFTDPSYPFADGFADYITMQNAPLTPMNVEEIARCLKPGGVVDLWIDQAFKQEIEQLAKKLCSKPEYDVEDEFKGSTGSVKIRIVSTIVPSEDKIIGSACSGTQSTSKTEIEAFRQEKLAYSATAVMFFNSVYRRNNQVKMLEYSMDGNSESTSKNP